MLKYVIGSYAVAGTAVLLRNYSNITNSDPDPDNTSRNGNTNDNTKNDKNNWKPKSTVLRSFWDLYDLKDSNGRVVTTYTVTCAPILLPAVVGSGIILYGYETLKNRHDGINSRDEN